MYWQQQKKLVTSLLNTLKHKSVQGKEIVAMQGIHKNKIQMNSTISYVISRIILLAVLGQLLSVLVLSITGIILFVVGLIINTLVITGIIISLIISVIQIYNNFIEEKTMTGKSKRILFFQRVEAGVNP